MVSLMFCRFLSLDMLCEALGSPFQKLVPEARPLISVEVAKLAYTMRHPPVYCMDLRAMSHR